MQMQIQILILVWGVIYLDPDLHQFFVGIWSDFKFFSLTRPPFFLYPFFGKMLILLDFVWIFFRSNQIYLNLKAWVNIYIYDQDLQRCVYVPDNLITKLGEIHPFYGYFYM